MINNLILIYFLNFINTIYIYIIFFNLYRPILVNYGHHTLLNYHRLAYVNYKDPMVVNSNLYYPKCIYWLHCKDISFRLLTSLN